MSEGEAPLDEGLYRHERHFVVVIDSCTEGKANQVASAASGYSLRLHELVFPATDSLLKESSCRGP